jgi:hypothetical protein
VVDSYYPARTCRATQIACDKRSQKAGEPRARGGAVGFVRGLGRQAGADARNELAASRAAASPLANPLALLPARRHLAPAQWASREACCAPSGGAFGQGCSTYVPKAPCYTIDTYNPVRSCKLETDVARCNRGEPPRQQRRPLGAARQAPPPPGCRAARRCFWQDQSPASPIKPENLLTSQPLTSPGWGVFQSLDVCCAPGAAFSEGCTATPPPTASPAAAGR